MNYSYFIHDLRRSMIIKTDGSDSYDTFVVEENSGTRREWSISRLQKNIETISKFDRTSFIRTREWLLQNHPELLL
jgi:hypothetical protein